MDMLTPILETGSGVPLYQQLYAFIKKEILSSRIAPDTKLPSKRKLSAYLEISQNTIQSAYEQLIAEGYVYSLEKKGFYAAKIDHIHQLDVRSIINDRADLDKLDTISYDFSYHGVDIPSFPFTVWRRLAREVINEYDRELLQLGDPQGHIRLRTAIADYLHQSRGVNCSPEQIIISSGTELLMLALIQLLGSDSVYALENPGYEKLSMVFSANKARFTAVNIDESGMIPDEVYDSPVNVLSLTPAHQFPSGGIMPISRRIQLLNWANKAADRYIIEDDYDGEFKYSGRPIPAMQGLDGSGKVIYMGAFSKSLTPALRISYMVLPQPLLYKYLGNLSYFICPVSVIAQKVLSRFIEDGHFERHLNRMRLIYKRKRETLTRTIRAMGPGIEISGADAGQHLLLRVDNGMNEEQLVSSAAAQGVKVYGISSYYLSADPLPEPPRILLGFAAMEEEDISAAVSLLHKAWRENTATTCPL